jgi:CheY-like chemotaxis protein
MESMNYHILLVEDDEDDIYLTRRVISRALPSLHLTVMRDGAEAMAYINSPLEPCDCPLIIFLDLNLPKVCGLTLIRAIRSLPVYANTPVIVLSSSDYEKDKTDCLSSGATLYLSKPLSTARFQEIINQSAPAIAGG